MSEAMFQLGPVSFSLTGRGDDPVYEAVVDELSVLPTADGRRPPVRFSFVDELSTPDQMIHAGRWQLADGVVVGDGWGYQFCMRRRDEGFDVEVAAEPTDRSMTDHFDRAWDWNFLAPWESTAKNFMYDLFDLVTAAALVERKASYLHASTCARDGAAVALIAWGGVGKTTSVLKLVTEDGWRFLSDDLGLVDDEGRLWRTPRKLQVYAYNVEGEPALRRRVMEGRGPIDRVNWHWRLARFGPKKVRRRIGAEALFGDDSVAEVAPLKKAIFLERVDVDAIRWQEIGVEALARRSATILVDELDTLVAVAVAAESHGVDVGIPGLDELRETMTEILVEAFEGVPAVRLQIPIDAGPDALADALRQKLPASG